jgi:hypothetical protein
MAVSDSRELNGPARRDEDGVETSLDGLIPRAEHTDQYVVAWIRLLDRSSEGEVLTDIELDLPRGVVDFEHRVGLHHQWSVERVKAGAIESEVCVLQKRDAARAARLER